MYFSCTIVRNPFCQFRLNEYDDENRQDSIFHLEDTTLGAIFKKYLARHCNVLSSRTRNKLFICLLITTLTRKHRQSYRHADPRRQRPQLAQHRVTGQPL